MSDDIYMVQARALVDGGHYEEVAELLRTNEYSPVRSVHPDDCLCDDCTCGGCGEKKHEGRCKWGK
jgi:hypothetical protein